MVEVLRITGAKKRFGETEALRGVDLALGEKEWLALLGPNGAGKTTLVRAIAGRVRPDEGRFTLFGEALDGGSAGAARRRLGIVPQEAALYPLLTARENLSSFGALNGLSGRELADRVAWALDWTGLADRAREPVRRFSGGMKRRLNLACGVLHRPDILLLDEPTVGVDPQSRERIWEMLAEIRDGGASLLLTTHQLDEAQSVANRIVIIDHGKVIADGTFEELLAETIGRDRRVLVRLTDGTDLVRRVRDVAADLPRVLEELKGEDAGIADLRIEEPTLQSVFLHLTGRELRE